MSGHHGESEKAAPDLLIGDWRVSAERNELSRGGKTLRLEPKAIEVLGRLAARAGEVVSREELLEAVWPGVIVGDDALSQAIIKLRRAFGDDAREPRYIQTISKRGYRLVAPIASPAPLAASETSRKTTHRRAALIAASALLAAFLAALVGTQILRRAPMPWPLAADTRSASTASIPVVAILPLANLSGDPKRDHFSAGVTEDLIEALGRFSGVRVLSRNAVQQLRASTPPPPAIREAVGADYVLQGSLREANGKVRVAVELSDTATGMLLWAERYDGEGAQVFEIQDRIARNIVGSLHVRLTRLEQARVFTKPTESLDAYDLVLRARALLEEDGRAANREARELLSRAEKLAPDYAEIFVTFAQAEIQRAHYGWIEDPAEGLRRAEMHATRALASPDQRAHARAHSLIALSYGYQNRFEEALRHTEQALELNPSDSMALYRHGSALLFLGRLDEAIAAMETAKRYEPPAGTRINLSLAYYVAGRYPQALADVDGLLAHAPHLATLHAIRAATLAQLGRLEEAREAAGEVRRLSPLFRVMQYGAHFANPAHTEKIREGLRVAGLQ